MPNGSKVLSRDYSDRRGVTSPAFLRAEANIAQHVASTKSFKKFLSAEGFKSKEIEEIVSEGYEIPKYLVEKWKKRSARKKFAAKKQAAREKFAAKKQAARKNKGGYVEKKYASGGRVARYKKQ